MMIKNKQPQRFKEKVFTLSTLVLCMPAYANSAPQFNTRFVHGAQNITSVVQIARNDGLSEGTFEYDIYIDHSFIETRNAEESPDDLQINHQIRVEAHLVA
ncbi:hypothetical protein ACTM32_16460 [Citrobacter freundii]|uniref:hypothetical protein n=1 Tax=Citrobacter freundii TaxID=546 RepID=UPI002B2741C8|nr:hypothetical protein [Citrobacter freundii]MEA8863773.1 hypothetical protein [Citrobacter freundii]